MACFDSSRDSHVCVLLTICKMLLGTLFLIVGIVLVLTFWLMPVGLLLALLGVAFIADGDVEKTHWPLIDAFQAWRFGKEKQRCHATVTR